MSRVLKEGWLQAYRRYVFKQESPDLFHFWTAMTMISSALRRHVWIDRKAYTIFPNLYVFLVEESAAARKSTAMELGLSLLWLSVNLQYLHPLLLIYRHCKVWIVPQSVGQWRLHPPHHYQAQLEHS